MNEKSRVIQAINRKLSRKEKEVIAPVRLPKAAGLPSLPLLLTVPNPRNTDEIVLCENGIVVRQKSRALPLRQLLREQRIDAMRSAIQAQADLRRAGVIGVLYQFLQHSRSLGVVHQNLSNSPREIDSLTKILQ